MLALHELVQHEHDSIGNRLSSALAQANAASAALVQSEIGRLGTLQRDERLANARALEEATSKAAVEQRTALSALQESLSAQLATTWASASESQAAAVAAWREELQQALVAAQQLQERRLTEEHDIARQQVTEALEHQVRPYVRKGTESCTTAEICL